MSLKTIYEDRYSYRTDVKFTDLSGIGRLEILTKQPAIVTFKKSTKTAYNTLIYVT